MDIIKNIIEMRDIKELLILLLARLVFCKNAGIQKAGLCVIVSNMEYDGIISFCERRVLIQFIQKYAIPKPYMLRYYCECGMHERNQIKSYAFYWKPFDLDVRIKWVKKQIDKL